MPEPDDTTSLEHILDFREDADTRRKRIALRRWITEAVKSDFTALEVRQKLEYLLEEYEWHMRRCKMRVNKGLLETIVTTAGDIAEDILKIRWGKLARFPFMVAMKKLELLEAESNAPGREIAYIQTVRERFGR